MSSHLKFYLWILLPECWGDNNSKATQSPINENREPNSHKSHVVEDKELKGSKSPASSDNERKDKKSPVVGDEILKGGKSPVITHKEQKSRKSPVEATEPSGNKSPVITHKERKGRKSMIENKESKGSKSPVIAFKEPKSKKSPVVGEKERRRSKSPNTADKKSRSRKSPVIGGEEPKVSQLPVIADKGLIFTNIIFRHGARNILQSYPRDPWRKSKNPGLWEGGYGNLTDVGRQQLLELGKFFRRRYENLLKQGTHPLDLIYVQSSESRRTEASAKSCIDGFFPQTDNQTYNNGLKWQAIPINLIPKEMDCTIKGTRTCLQWKRDLAKLKKSTDYKILVENSQQLFKKLEKASGLTIKSIGDVCDLYDTLNTEMLRNLTLPKWTNELLQPMEHIAQLVYMQWTETTPLARLRSGFLIRDMLHHFTDKIESKLKQSIWVYSGHDSTIFSLLHTLKVHDMRIPTYAATVLFELYKSNNDYYVQLFYKNTTAEVLYPIDIPNCGTNCPLKSFQEVYKDVIPTGDFDTECRNPVSVVADEGLVFANILFRHGERNIIDSYPTDPWGKEQNPDLWKGGRGTLTKVGKKQLFELGKYFRRRYENLLKEGTHPLDLVYVQSSDVRRTITSAKSCIDGFFPPKVDKTYKNGRKWEEIPINAIPKENDHTIKGTMLCEKYRDEQEMLRNSTEFKTLLRSYEPMFQKLEDDSGLIIENFRDLSHLFDTLNTEKLRGLTLPDWAEESFHNIEQVAYLHYKQKTETKSLARLRSGFLIRDMLDHFNDKIESKLKQSIWIYSGHDITIFSLLQTLEVLEDLGMHIPPYAAAVLFELYKSNEEYYVQLFYKNTTDDVIHPIEIPNCGTKCCLKKFREVYNDVIPGDFETECRVPDE